MLEKAEMAMMILVTTEAAMKSLLLDSGRKVILVTK